MKCKVINSNKNTIEAKINDWLKTDEFEIVNMVQTQENSYVTLTILYYDTKEIRKLKLNKLEEL